MTTPLHPLLLRLLVGAIILVAMLAMMTEAR